jgi:hypothetical protein
MISHTEAIRILLLMFLMLCLGILGPIIFQVVYHKKINMEMRVMLAGLCITVLILYQWFYSFGLIMFNVR